MNIECSNYFKWICNIQNIFDGIEAETYIPYSQVIGVRAQKPCYLWAIRGWLGECSKMVEAATGHLLPRNPHTLDYCYVQSWVQGLLLLKFDYWKCLNNAQTILLLPVSIDKSSNPSIRSNPKKSFFHEGPCDSSRVRPAPFSSYWNHIKGPLFS